MIKKIPTKVLSGFMELLPCEQILFNRIKNNIQKVYEKFGFLPIDTPLIERSEILLAKAGGETEKQIYRFKKGENDLSLRFDLTVPLARYVSQHYNDLIFPFRRYQIGKVYRGERAQKGRFREFYQCDADIIGDGKLSVKNDAEMAIVIYEIFANLEFADFTIKLNNRKILSGFFEGLKIKNKTTDIFRIIDKLDKIGKTQIKKELSSLNLSNANIEAIFEFINIRGESSEIFKKLKSLKINSKLFKTGVEELEEIIKYIKYFKIPDKNYEIDISIARGLDYYTGTVYETILNDYPNIGSVCSGGRYDNLAEYYINKKLPGVGISIGLTRLFHQLSEANIIDNKEKNNIKALIAPMTDNMEIPFKIAYILRVNNISAQIYFEDVKFKKKMNYADKQGIPYVIIVGEDEIKENKYTLKDMKTGKQTKVKIEKIAELISSTLERG